MISNNSFVKKLVVIIIVALAVILLPAALATALAVSTEAPLLSVSSLDGDTAVLSFPPLAEKGGGKYVLWNESTETQINEITNINQTQYNLTIAEGDEILLCINFYNVSGILCESKHIKITNYYIVIIYPTNLTEDWYVKEINQLNSFNLAGYICKSFGNFTQTSGALSINLGQFIVEGDITVFGNLNFDGGRIYVGGNFILSGAMKMDNADDYMLVGGNVIFNSGIWVAANLTEGMLEIKGDFTQYNMLPNFNAVGNNTTFFSGNRPPTISFDDPVRNGFANVLFNTNSAILRTPIRGFKLYADFTILPGSTDNFGIMSGTLDLNGHRLSGITGDFTQSNSFIYLNGGRIDIPGNYIQLGYSLFIGGGQCDVGGDFLSNYSVNLGGGQLNVNGNFTQTSGWLTLENGKFIINGNFTLSESAAMNMSNTADYMLVGGNVIISSGYWGAAYMVDGVLEIKGDFTQLGAHPNYDASGNHITCFSGNTPPIISFDNPARNGFAKAQFNTNSAIFLTAIRGFTLSADFTILPGSTDNFGIMSGTLDLAGYRLSGIPENFTQSNAFIYLHGGILSIPGNYTQYGYSLFIDGGLCDVGGDFIANNYIGLAGGQLNVNGNFIQAEGWLSLEGGRLSIDGNFTLSGSGTMKMDNNNDYMFVGGSVEISSGIWGAAYVVDGVMEIKGDFTQKGMHNPHFDAHGNHTTIFSGCLSHNISFDDINRNKFANLYYTNKTIFLTPYNAIYEEQLADHMYGTYEEIIKAATIDEEGLMGIYCFNCGDLFETRIIERIICISHLFMEKVTKVATCAEEGEKTYTCSVCGDSYTEEIDKDSNFHVGGTYENLIKAATVDEEGLMGIYCFGCGELRDTRIIEKLACDHDYLSVVTKPATCAEEGEKTYTCSVCGDSYTEEIEKDSNNHVGGTYENLIKAATVDEEGLMGIYCSSCGELHDTRIIEKLVCDHDYLGVVTKPATCAEEGEKTYTCSVCGDSYTEMILKLSHDWMLQYVVEPTETAGGYTLYICKLCGVEKEDDITPPITQKKSNAEFLQALSADILKNGLSKDNLQLDGKILTLVIDGREFVLSVNANNRNISGEISIGDGYYLVFDLKGNGSNIKEFSVIKR